MSTTTLRKISIMLAAVLIVGQIAACGSDTPSSNDTASGDTTTAETTPELTGRDAEKDNLPETDLGGATYTILARDTFAYEFVADEENGDTLNDAVYKRNRKIEERFNVNIETVLQTNDNYNSVLRSSVQSDSGAYDLVAGYAYQITALVLDDLFLNWYDVKHIDLSRPWWSKQVADELTVNNTCFTISGDLAVSLWNYFFVFLYNKKLADEFQIGDIYATVRSGDWTLDKLIELTANTYKDLDGDTKRTMADSYGLIASNTTPVDAFLDAFQIPITTKNSAGIPEFTLDSEKTVDVLAKLIDFNKNNGNAMITDKHADVKTTFREGRALFYATPMSNVVGFRDMNDDFGIIPYPKLDKSQDKYYSTAMDNFSFLLMPVDVKDADRAGLVTEALAAESYRSVVPAFYDVVLKTKVSRDDDSAEMLDIIRDSITFNFGYSFANALNGPGHLFQEKFKAGSTAISSTWNASAKIYQQKLDALLSHFGV